MRAKLGVAAGLTVLAAPLAMAEPITAMNWQRHLAIVEIRAIYREIKQVEGAGLLRKLEKQWPENCEPRSYEDTERVLYLDARGVVRSYHFGGGSEDSAVRRALYYDRDGRLRFVLIRAGAVNGTSLEHRVYLSKTGRRLWEVQTLLEGPGYTFPSRQWWEEDLVRDPRRAFDKKARCAGG